MKNHGNFIICLGELCQYLAKKAEELGCEIYLDLLQQRFYIMKKEVFQGINRPRWHQQTRR